MEAQLFLTAAVAALVTGIMTGAGLRLWRRYRRDQERQRIYDQHLDRVLILICEDAGITPPFEGSIEDRIEVLEREVRRLALERLDSEPEGQ